MSVRVHALVASRFALDGGAMHGAVPKLLWQRIHPADADNRIRLVARVAAVEDRAAGTLVLVDTGAGQRWSAKERRHHALEEGPELPDVLRAAGLDPEAVTHVVLTHLHWDHAGGLALSGEPARLAFPKAEHVVSELCLRQATADTTREVAGLATGLRELLLHDAKLRLYHPGDTLAPGLEGRLVGGHTEGHILPLARQREDGPPLAFPTDLAPTRSHLRPGWVMGYDAHPHQLAAEKQALFEELSAMGGGVCLYHDPEVVAAWAVSDAKGVHLVPGDLAGHVTS